MRLFLVAGRAHISAETRRLIEGNEQYQTEARPPILVKVTVPSLLVSTEKIELFHHPVPTILGKRNHADILALSDAHPSTSSNKDFQLNKTSDHVILF